MAKKVWVVLQQREGRLHRMSREAIAAGQRLAGAIGGNTGDGEVDRVTINGTVGDDTIHVQSLQETVAIDANGVPIPV